MEPLESWSGLLINAVIQCIYAVLKRVIFAVSEEELVEGEDPLSVVLQCQISDSADEDGLSRLLKHLGDSPWCESLPSS